MADNIMGYSETLKDSIKGYFKQNGWKYTFDEERGIFMLTIALSGKLKSLRYFVYIKESDYTVYAVSPVGVDVKDEKMKLSMMEFLTRVNYGIKDGCFEMDLDDGEIRYKSYVNCAELMPSNLVIMASLYCPGMMFDRYSHGLENILFYSKNAEESYKECEREIETELLRLFSGVQEDNAEEELCAERLETRLGLKISS